MSKKKASGSQRSREKAIPAYEEAVKSVQQWNEALKGSTVTRGNIRRMSIDKGTWIKPTHFLYICDHLSS